MKWKPAKCGLLLLLLAWLPQVQAGAGTGLVEEYVPAPEVWETPQFRPEGFQFEIQISSLGTSYDGDRVRASIEAHDLGEYESVVSPVIAAEWGYSFTHLDGQTDGAGRQIEAGYPKPPASRSDCFPVIEAFLQRQYIRGGARPWASMNGHFPWHHYAAEFGFDQIGSEVGENINNYQWHIALNRGAARQYRRPWFIDFSAWHGPGINDYSDGRIWGENSHPDYGHSMSLFERTLFTSYMSGAGQIMAEAGGALAFLTTLKEHGHYELSPYGEVCKRFRDFTLAHPDVGVPYTPFAVLLDFHHGAYPGFGARKVFWHFDYNAGDTMTWELIDLLWPGGWEVMGKEEQGTLVNGPYGDTFDILLQNAPQDVLNSYPALIPSGDLQLTPEEVARLREYVAQGGTLILNSAHAHWFAELPEGKGRVIRYGPDYDVQALGAILHEELSRLLPVRVSGEVQYLINLKPDAVVVTLINNAGVTKAPIEKPRVDPAQRRMVIITWKDGGKLGAARELRQDEALVPGEDGSLVVELMPGEVKVVECRAPG